MVKNICMTESIAILCKNENCRKKQCDKWFDKECCKSHGSTGVKCAKKICQIFTQTRTNLLWYS